MIYLDTSVALLSLLGQPGADQAAWLIMDAHATEGLVSSCLLTVEMARAAHREHFDIRVVDEFIEGVELVEIGAYVADSDPDAVLPGYASGFDAGERVGYVQGCMWGGVVGGVTRGRCAVSGAATTGRAPGGFLR